MAFLNLGNLLLEILYLGFYLGDRLVPMAYLFLGFPEGLFIVVNLL